MTLQQLRDLIAVVTHGGYRSAARTLGLSQAGLTKSIAKLEQDCGLVLIDRNGKGVVLSAAGKAFLRHAQSIVLEVDRAEAWLATSRAPGVGAVSLGVSIEPSLYLVPAVLKDFRRMMPQVELRISHGVSSALLAGVRESRLDFCVSRLSDDTDASDLQVQMLLESEAVIAARVDHPLCATNAALDRGAFHWVVMGDPSQPADRDPSIRELFDARSLPRPHIAAVTDSLFDVVSMLTSSDCLARLPRTVLAHPLIEGKLVGLPSLETPHRYRIALVAKTARPLSPAARMLAAMLVSFARGSGARTSG